MSEDYLIRNCAPTLAGIKTANLFSCPCESRAEMTDSLRSINHRLHGKGVRAVPLRFSENRALIYLYRPSRLRADFADGLAGKLLQERGYDTADCNRCVVQLMRRLQADEEFPHEIGLFLGYPPEDVQGFIDNRAENCKCVGCWKVYGDAQAAQKKFRQFKRCTRVYCERWRRGSDIERLTIAG